MRNVSAEIGEYCQQAVFETVGEGKKLYWFVTAQWQCVSVFVRSFYWNI